MREETFALGWTAANKRPLAACTVFRAFGAVRHDPDQLPAGRPRRVHSRQLLFDSVTISVSRPRFRGRRSELNHSADTKAGTWMNPRRPGFRMLPNLPLHPPLIPTGDLAKNDLEMIMLARFLRAQEAATLLRLLSGPICPSASALQPCVLGSPCPGLRILRAQGKFEIPLFRLPPAASAVWANVWSRCLGCHAAASAPGDGSGRPNSRNTALDCRKFLLTIHGRLWLWPNPARRRPSPAGSWGTPEHCTSGHY